LILTIKIKHKNILIQLHIIFISISGEFKKMGRKLIIVIILLFFILDGTVSNFVTSIDDIQNKNCSNSKLKSRLPKPTDLTNNEKLKQSVISNNYFCKNSGQIENIDVRFYGQDGSVWFTDDGIWFELREELNNEDHVLGLVNWESKALFDPTEWFLKPALLEHKRVVVKQEFVGANTVRPIGKERLSWNSNFFYGNDSSEWRSNVPNFHEVYYKDLYDGIDLKYYTHENDLKYDFIIHPGANINDIRLRYKGADIVELDGYGNMEIQTESGRISDNDLFIYQDDNGYKKSVDGNFKKLGNYEVGFEVLDEYHYDKRLIIDPTIKLGYSTFVGGKNDDGMVTHSSIDSDANGSTIIAGRTNSLDFPTTPGVYNNSYYNNYDIIVFKLDRNGTNLIFSTYVGGNDFDGNFGLSTDRNDNVYVTGITSSSDFPTTNGSFDTDLNNQDSFVFKLSANGSVLLYSTFLGGSGTEQFIRIKVDSTGYAHVSGTTGSSDFPVTSGAFDTSYNGGDCFLTKFNMNGSELLYSTFIGGSGAETCYGMDLDSNGSVFITGHTDSNDYPIKGIPFDDTFNGVTDIFVTKFNHNGSDLMFSTYIGGSSNDGGSGIVVDQEGYVTLTGVTYSTDFPITNGSFDNTSNGTIDSFILKLDPNGSSLIFSTYIGGTGFDYSYDITLDHNGNSYITGDTKSLDFPTTANALNDTNNGYADAFLFVLDSNGSKMIYSTYIGGMGFDGGAGVNIDRKGNVIISGNTGSTDFPTTPYAFDRTHNGGVGDLFVLNLTFYQYMEVTSVSLIVNNSHTDKIYSRYCPYTFRVNITNTEALSDLNYVRLNLDPGRTNIQLIWDRTTGKFSELFDPFNYMDIDQSSNFNNDSWTKWTIDFNITFNWTFPHEEPNNVQVFAKSLILQEQWFNISNMFNVENDLVFKGKLKVFGSDDRKISKNGLVRGGEHLKWTGLKVVYENTTDIYPPEQELNIINWGEDDSNWVDSPGSGKSINISTITPIETLDSFNYTINIIGIPSECDKTDQKFTIQIDANNVTFSNPWPGEDDWQKRSEVYLGIRITDQGGGFVDNTSIFHSLSEDNGSTWSSWQPTDHAGISESITVHDFIIFEDGDDNLIKWRANDNVGNGPAESEPYRILVDTQPIFFSNPIPSFRQISYHEEVRVGITILDNTSGVNTSTIKFSTSSDDGNYWNSWTSVDGFQDGRSVDVILNLTFTNGTGNRIRWRANDIARNGLAYSDEYVINVNISKPPIIPKIKLLSPINNSKISSTSVELSWEVIENNYPNIVFDIMFNKQYPPLISIKKEHKDTSILIEDLKHGQTYYWTVIPRLNKVNGTCTSGTWSFKVEIPLPKAILKTPENNSIIASKLPTLVWISEYEGSDKVTYDIYFGTNKDPPLIQERLSTTYLSLTEPLEDNIIYYWKIIPWVSEYQGISSEIWSFSVQLPDDEIPKFKLQLGLMINTLVLKPGEQTTITALVTNLGTIQDEILLTYTLQTGFEIEISILGDSQKTIKPNDTVEFYINIKIPEKIEIEEKIVIFTATSQKALDYDLDIKEEEILTINIKDDERPDNDEPDDFLWLIILIIVVLLIIIILIIFISKKKKVTMDEEIQQEMVVDLNQEPNSKKEQDMVGIEAEKQLLIVEDKSLSTKENLEE
jgi:hypothetical protein